MKRFYISQKYRGIGIAQKLLEELIKEAKAQGVKKIILDVSKDNPRAVRFYEKSGFTRTTVTPDERWIESFQAETYYYFYKGIGIE
ncbi:GNAT family N-acetyltransferase [Candidatus Gottesmanbacteria bacterium]|nr:GNAT family N-acetyltransferase [Candidatus Gottesmanbacteria bacterium]